ncbi:MAG: uncharacterized protein KVP18_004862 [Porospora cf. gigantea A]|uniref:uncharacterized protein n=1 Tax=Porospora cf. gigantea A TaxID=2853593 RepID=UPI00355AC8FC|nr:MAG: hypothetical protein KVP18_004862 [Porospora cf. gigantea A]
MVDHSAIDSVELSEVSACERNNMVGARTTPSDALQIPTCSGSMESPYSSEVSGGSSRPHYSIPAEEPFSRHRGSGPTERWMDATQSGTEGNLVLSPLVTCSVSESEALKRRTEEYISESGGTNTLRSRPMAEFAYPDAFGGEVLETSLLTEDHYQCGEVNVALVDINDVDHDVLDQLERYDWVVNPMQVQQRGEQLLDAFRREVSPTAQGRSGLRKSRNTPSGFYLRRGS